MILLSKITIANELLRKKNANEVVKHNNNANDIAKHKNNANEAAMHKNNFQ